MSGTPDVAMADEVVCPCGQYRVTAALLAEIEWPGGNQVVAPCCGALLEVWATS